MKVDKIIIHCSDSNSILHNSIHVIRKWHKERGFKDVGYHYFILYNGGVQNGRPLDEDSILEPNEVGAHAKGQNFNSIGICLHGRDSFTHDQYRALAVLIRKLAEQFDLKKGFIYPHNAFNKKKTCPNFDIGRYIKYYLPEYSKDGEGAYKATKPKPAGSKRKPAASKAGSNKKHG